MNKTIKIELINNMDLAKDIWNRLSPNKNLCDNWDFRYCFYKYFNYSLNFYVGYFEDDLIGLLPLQYNEEKKYLEFFGGDYMRDNRVFIKPGYEIFIPKFYEAISLKAELKKITGEDLYTESLEIFKYKYVINLSGLKTADDYFVDNFKARSRKKLRNSIKSIETLKPEITLNKYEDMDVLMELNKKAFVERSSFNKSHRMEIFRDLMKLNYDIYLMTFVISGKKEAVSLAIKFKDTYNYINAGTNKDISNLGSYVIYRQIEKAIETDSKMLDAGLGDLGWKEKWHLIKSPQYIFKKML